MATTVQPAENKPETSSTVETASAPVPASPPVGSGRIQLPSRPRVTAGWIVPGVAQWKINGWIKQLQAVNRLEPARREMTESQIKKEARSLQYRVRSGESPLDLLADAYSLVREAAHRSLNMRHYDVQILGGIAQAHGCIAEMQTGEGKTLTATLSLFAHSLIGKGAHLATVNDYLAERDAQWMDPLFRLLGTTVGIVLTPDQQDQRRKAYACDITYGTAKEFGFDFLRDRLLMRAAGRLADGFLGTGSQQRWSNSGDSPVQRGMHFVLVDEADSILIDEARTPLIIGSLGDTTREIIIAMYRWTSENAKNFNVEEHYKVDPNTRRVELNAKGRQLVRALPRSEEMRLAPLIDLYDYTERAIRVARDYHIEQQYVIRDKEIVIVDEFTGRLAEGRKWRDGIHQAVEAKEGLEVSVPTGQAARITVQELFLRYQHLGGMTGTAATSAKELRRIYRTPVVQVPTNRPPQRLKLGDQVYGTMVEKFEAIVQNVKEAHDIGRPVLIGTRSIDKSNLLASMLRKQGYKVEILNANEIAREAEIVAQAGRPGQITVATNMAGRGTDIKLKEDVKALGGMFVVCTELHDAARIDRQLIGRCGRQGDPGTYRQYMSLDDDILKNAFGLKKFERYRQIGASSSGSLPRYVSLFKRAQRKVERKHFRDRMSLMYHEKERTKIQKEMGQDPYLDTAE